MASRMRLPEVELTLQELRTAQQVQTLRERRIDVGVLRPPIRAEAFAVETICRDLFMDVLPHTQPTRYTTYTTVRHFAAHHLPACVSGFLNELSVTKICGTR
jgi:DNA-binding transcriptional LysR family regulator